MCYTVEKGGGFINSVIFNPLEEYNKRLKALHADNTNAFFERLVQRSGVNIEENRKTVKEYNECTEGISKLKRRLTLYKVLRVIMCLTVVLIPLVILWLNKKIKKLNEELSEADKRAKELMELAKSQMRPLNSLFTDKDATDIIESTVPLIKFEPCFTAKQELEMKTNFDFTESTDPEQSTTELLSGSYNENPFLFENRLIHSMGTETYHGYRTISWTEHYFDSNGKRRTRRRTQTLHATVVKPKPFYRTQVVLNYGAQGAPELCFSRDASHLQQKSEKELKRHIKKGEKRLKKKTDKAIEDNKEFVSMSNTDFEVLFDALDRTSEVQYRTLFTPLAQTNMVDLILSKDTFGDDFNFIKHLRMNKIISTHSQGRAVKLTPSCYTSYSFDIIKENFTVKNEEFFKAVYFDFAPILAIPAYQERPVQSLKPLPDYSRIYSARECEALANAVDSSQIVHPATKTKAILKSSFVKTKNNIDEICVNAHSYKTIPRVDVVSVFGGDGRFHSVSVPWDEYIPLELSTALHITSLENAPDNIIASKNGLCIYK